MAVIKVENLSKKYILDHEGQERYTSMRDVVARKVKKIFSFPQSLKSNTLHTKEEFYALKDFNFEIQQGDRLGIIGRNGAGKSTLLKVLSRITEPTTGRITINGRVASLLEVGTGFHPELTGRENIYLNGAILGMTRQEIRTKYDEIVDFAGVEKFLDTPVKRYSSGMYVRLAFAVAAHLEPEILIVDEVLAVGDAEFQKKCLGKMESISQTKGRTVLFVSHNLSAISQLCSKAVLLNKGILLKFGSTSNVIEEYNNIDKNNINFYENSNANDFEIVSVKLNKTISGSSYDFNDVIRINISVNVPRKLNGLYIGVALKDKWERKIFTTQYPIKESDLTDKKIIKTVTIPSNLLLAGNYNIDVACFVPNISTYSYLSNICPFRVIDYQSEMALYSNSDVGVINVNCYWD